MFGSLLQEIYLLYSSIVQVREMGKLLGVPASFVSRHPFPGPGLAVRIMGDVTQGNALETIRLVWLDPLTVANPWFTIHLIDFSYDVFDQ